MLSHELTIAEGGIWARTQLMLLLGYASVSRVIGRRGLQRLSWTLGSVFPHRDSVILSSGDRRIKLYLDDGYYARLLYRGFVYEVELESVLDKVLTDKTVFVDGGANNGYWSVFAALKTGHPERVVAIEATSGSFARLEENRRLNDNSFQVMKKAIYSKSDMDLEFAIHPRRHAENTCTVWAGGWPADPRSHHEVVKSVTVDDVCNEILRGQEGINDVVVKLDVEGAEVEAFQGAQKTIEGGALLLYEDHGLDPSCHNTEYLLKQFQLLVYLLQEDSRPIKIDDIDQLRRLKKEPKKPYNLMAGKPSSASLQKALQVC